VRWPTKLQDRRWPVRVASPQAKSPKLSCINLLRDVKSWKKNHGQSAHIDRQSSTPQQTIMKPMYARESSLPTRAYSGRSNHESATGTASRQRMAATGTREAPPQSWSMRQSASDGTSTIITLIRRASQSSQGSNGVVSPQKKRQQLEP